MAEENKKIEGGAISMKDAGERIIVLIFFLSLLAFILYSFGWGDGDGSFWTRIREGFGFFFHETVFGIFLSKVIFFIKFLGTYISLLFLALIIYTLFLLSEVKKQEQKAHGHVIGEVKSQENIEMEKWKRVEVHVSGESPSDWRLAILEADIMLEEMMEKMGHLGQTLGEKLKNTEKSDFATLDKAWEAHKIRNLIAHEGSDFLISQREARRVVELYKDVFDEFFYLN